MTEKDYFVALSTFLPFGPLRLLLLLKYFESAQNVWNAKRSELEKIGLKPKLVSQFLKHRNSFDYEQFSLYLKKHSIHTVIKDTPEYPSNLCAIQSAPYVLYVLGRIDPVDTDAVAIVGTRNMSSYGRDVCIQFAESFAQSGLTVVSGLALGIDAIAHKATLDSGGRTIAVLASGLDTITPATNKWIADKIVKNDLGAIISEYPPRTPAMKGYFPHRNRLISGLSKSVLIVEGRIKSGTIHTAHHASDQGKTVFAIPGNINSPLSELPHYLLQNGAKLATNPKDILEEFDMEFRADKMDMARILPTDEVELSIVNYLSDQDMHIDEIVRIIGVDTNTVTAKLVMMELKGLVRQIDDGVYGLRI